MATSWQTSQQLPLTKITKNSSVPDVTRGVLFPKPDSSNQFFPFGGTTDTVNTSFAGFQSQNPKARTLWLYDAPSNEWNSFATPNILRLVSGASTVLDERPHLDGRQIYEISELGAELEALAYTKYPVCHDGPNLATVEERIVADPVELRVSHHA
jgi:hypothetical protein